MTKCSVPFLIAWALWDFIVLHGDDRFQQNWFYWTDVALFSPANTGGSILDSAMYERVLLSMLIAGVASSMKRTALGLYFGKKTVLNFKLQMDKILADMAIIGDVGELAVVSGEFVSSASAPDEKKLLAATIEKKEGDDGMVTSSQWEDIEYIDSLGERSDMDEKNRSDLDDTDDDLDEDDDDERLSDTKIEGSDDKNSSEGGHSSETSKAGLQSNRSTAKSLSGSDRLFKSLLDRWQEPSVAKKVWKHSARSPRDS